MPAYRWNTSEFATGYDAAAEIIHPFYLAIQDAILDLLTLVLNSQLPPAESRTASPERPPLVIDLGGGSGRLVARILNKFPLASALVIDQSEPFLALAERRLASFGPRATCLLSRLQDDWPSQVPGPVTAIVSMSAIHHLDPAEKQDLYQRCHDVLIHHGLLLNGDEIRAESDAEYLTTLTTWADHMRAHMASGQIPAPFHPALLGWIDRNITRFGQQKKSGDDMHETIAAQLGYCRASGFTHADCPWHHQLWAVLRGIK